VKTNEFVYKYTNNMLPQVFLNQFKQILLSIRIIFALQLSLDHYFFGFLLNNSALDTRESGPTTWKLEWYSWKH